MNPSTGPHGRNEKDSRVVGNAIQEREMINFIENRTSTNTKNKKGAENLANDEIIDSKKRRIEEKEFLLSSSSSESYPIPSSVPYSTSMQKNFSSSQPPNNEYSEIGLQNNDSHSSITNCDVRSSLLHPPFDYNTESIEAENADSFSSAISSASSVSSFQYPPAPPTTPIIDVNSTFGSIPRKNSAAFHDIATPKQPLSGSLLPQLPADDAMELHQSQSDQECRSTTSVTEQERYTEKHVNERSANTLRRRQYQLSYDFGSWKVGPRYELMRILGKGSYGEVAQAKDIYHSQQGDKQPKYVAIKKIATSYEQDVDALHTFREIHLLRRLKGHDCIIQLIDVVAPESEHSIVGDIYLVFEYVDTDLYKLIMSPQYLTTAHIQTFLYQMLKGLKFLHSSSVIHRDLKPANILINEDCSLKICDFGLARIVSSDQVAKGNDYSDSSTSSSNSKLSSWNQPSLTRQLTKHVVTRWYRAPELILIQPYTTAVDIWSVGCIFAELLSMQQESVPSYDDRVPLFPGGSCFPLSGNLETKSSERLDQLSVIFGVLGMPSKEDLDSIGSAHEYVKKLERGPSKTLEDLYPGADPRAIDLLKKMLQFNPCKRCTAEEALGHEFLACVREKEIEKVSDGPLICPEFLNSDEIDVEEIKRKTLEELLCLKRQTLN